MPSYANIRHLIASLVVFAFPSLTFAQEGTSRLVNPLNAGSLEELLGVILGAVVELGSIALVLMLVYVGFLFVKAQGNEGAITKAREALMNAVIGGLLLLGASAIAAVLRATVETL